MWILILIQNILMNQLKYTEGDFGRLEGLQRDTQIKHHNQLKIYTCITHM